MSEFLERCESIGREADLTIAELDEIVDQQEKIIHWLRKENEILQTLEGVRV